MSTSELNRREKPLDDLRTSTLGVNAAYHTVAARCRI